MSQLPNDVEDWKLDARLDGNYVIHVFDEPDPGSRKRVVYREEHWRRKELLGRGSYGDVWLQECTKGQSSNQFRAVKQILVGKQGRLRPEACVRELEAIIKFSHRKYEKCFVKSYGWYEEANSLSITMEYLELGDLQNYMDDNDRFDEESAGHVTAQTVEALSFMHMNGFAHRDLKPANILIKSKPPHPWWVKIADFGITKRAEGVIGPSATIKGTEGYIAPELYGLIPRHDDFCPDIWAIGEITYRLLVKQPVFESVGILNKYTLGRAAFPALNLENLRIDGLVIDFVQSAMKPNPEERMTSHVAMKHPWIFRYLDNTDFKTSQPNDVDHLGSVEHVTEAMGTWTTQDTGDTIQRTVASVSESLDHSNNQLSLPIIQYPPSLSQVLSRSRRYLRHSARVKCLAFSPNNNNVASGSDDGYLLIWNATTGSVLHEIATFNELTCLAYSHDGTRIACGGITPMVRIYSTTDGMPLRIFETHLSEPAYSVSFSFDDNMIVVADRTGGARGWNYQFRNRMFFRPVDPNNLPGTVYSKLCFWEEQHLITCESARKVVRIYSFGSGRLESIPLDRHSHAINIAAFSHDGRKIATGSKDGNYGVWNTSNGQSLGKWQHPSREIHFMAFPTNGTVLALVSDKSTVAIVNYVTGIPLLLKPLVEEGEGVVTSIIFSQDDSKLVIGFQDGVAQLWGL